jgi:demethoxyubiquinone hydroxylase (CLK1/Coq7/Cat5 family)
MPERHDQSLQNLKSLLRLAYSAELAAAYAYRGHWRSVTSAEEKARIQQIENEELHHRRLVGEMLTKLDAQPRKLREIWSAFLGRALGLFCNLGGWLAPMYGAGRLESRNIREYETAARYARSCGHPEFVDCLLTMAEVEWEHEHYFRSRVASHRWARRIPLWPLPPARDTIRLSFENESLPAAKAVGAVERPSTFGYTGSQ